MRFLNLAAAVIFPAAAKTRRLTAEASPWSAAVGDETMWNQKAIIVVGSLLFFIILMLALVPLVKCLHHFMTLEPRRERNIRLSTTTAGLKPRVFRSFPTIVYQERPPFSSSLVSSSSSDSPSPSSSDDSSSSSSSSSSDCSICLSQFSQGDILRLMPTCSHGFHVSCIDAWLLSHASCPICRHNLLPQHNP